MTITVHHHPFSRAASTVWMLEEVGCDYRLEFVDMPGGAQKEPAFKNINAMGKLPTLVDDGVVVTESAAIGLYLADRYAAGRLAPALDSADRGTYLRWSFYAPSVIEPGCMAQASKWEYRAGSAGWGTYEEMLETIGGAIGDGPWLLGETFTMADVVFGGTLQFMTTFGMLEKRPQIMDYVERLAARPAAKKAEAINGRIAQERGLTPG